MGEGNGGGTGTPLGGTTSGSGGDKHGAGVLLTCTGGDGGMRGDALLACTGISIGGEGGEREGNAPLGNAGNARGGGTLIGSMGNARDSGLLGGICDGGGAHGSSVILGNRRSSDTYNGSGIRRGESGDDMGTVTGGAGHDLC